MTTDTIHTCSYSCERPGCIRAQRDELVSRLEALTAAQAQPDAGLDVEAVLRQFLTGDGFIAECDIQHIVAALTAQPAISGYTCTVPDDCETLHWRGQILSMNELAPVAQPATGEEIMVNTPYDVFTLPLQPSGLNGNAPRFVVHVPGPEQPAAVDEAMVERIAALLYEEAIDEPWTVAGIEHPGPDRDYYRGLARKVAALAAQPHADDEVVFIDGVGAGRSSIKSCRNGVQWIRVGDRVYWPLSDSDAKRLQSACCGNGSFDGPASAPPSAPSDDLPTLLDNLMRASFDDGDRGREQFSGATMAAREAVLAHVRVQQPAAVDGPDAQAAAARAERLAEALKEIRSRSSIDLAMRSDQFELTARLGDIYQIADAALSKENSND